MAKHEKKESKAEQMKEYGKVKRTPAPKQVRGEKPAPKANAMTAKAKAPTMMKKAPAPKMKKC
jgi:hypothetical protein